MEVRTSYTFLGSFQLDDVATKAVGRPADFSGAGMGSRDLGWIASSPLDAERMRRALNRVGLHATIRDGNRHTDYGPA